MFWATVRNIILLHNQISSRPRLITIVAVALGFKDYMCGITVLLGGTPKIYIMIHQPLVDLRKKS